MRRRGAAATELAIALPLVLLIVGGVVEWGWYFSRSTALVQVTRDAALAGVLTEVDDDPEGAALARAQDVLDALGFEPGSATVEATVLDTAQGLTLEVSASHPYDELLVFMPTPDQLAARAELRLEDQ